MSFTFAVIVLRTILASVAISGTIALSRKFLPASKVFSYNEDLDMEALDERFLPLRRAVWSAIILNAIAFFFVTYFLFIGINRYLAHLGSPKQFYFYPESAIFYFFPGFGGLALCWELTLRLWSIWRGSKFVNLFSDWSNLSTKFWGGNGYYSGINSRRVLLWMALLIALPIGVLSVLALNMHTAFDNEDMTTCGYAFTACKVHPYSSMVRITEVLAVRSRNGKLFPSPSIVLDFADGTRWSSRDSAKNSASANQAFAAFIEKAANIKPESAATEDDIPPLSKK